MGVGDDPTGIAAGRIDGDAIPDLVVTNTFERSVSVLLSTEGGGFARDDVRVGRGPVDVAIGRFNRDRRRDLAVASGSGVVSILLAKKGGRYTRRDVTAKGGADGLAVGRFNRDRRDDIAATTCPFCSTDREQDASLARRRRSSSKRPTCLEAESRD